MKRANGLGGIRWQPMLAVSPRVGPSRKTQFTSERATAGDGKVSIQRRTEMDITWVTDRIAVGGGIWTSENMAKVARLGVTHIIDMQIEFDDTPLGEEHG